MCINIYIDINYIYFFSHLAAIKAALFAELGVPACRQELCGWKQNHITDDVSRYIHLRVDFVSYYLYCNEQNVFILFETFFFPFYLSKSVTMFE